MSTLDPIDDESYVADEHVVIDDRVHYLQAEYDRVNAIVDPTERLKAAEALTARLNGDD